jgi:4-hydroxybenzoate polyprenyltransferase
MPLVWLGVVLIVLGVCVGLWAVTVIYTILQRPDDVPILAQILPVAQSGSELVRATRIPGGFTFAGSEGLRGIFAVFLLLFLFAALGGIVNAFISGGAKVIHSARVGRQSRPGSDT